MTTARGRRLTGPPHRTIVPCGPRPMRRRPVVERRYATFTGGQASLLRPSPPDGSNGDGVSRHRSSRVSSAARLARVAAAVALLATLVAAPASVVAGPATVVVPPPGLTMEAAVLLDGHARVGSWMAIDVHLKNDGPPITGELRLAGGTQGRTRFGTAVEPPTQSDQAHACTPSRPASGARSGQPGGRSDARSPRPRRSSRSTTGPSWSSASSPSDPATSSATSTCCRTRTTSSR